MRIHLRSELFFALALVIGCAGCGDKTPGQPVAQEAVKLSPEQELAELQKKAEAGDASAQEKLGLLYANGDGVTKNDAKAVEWLQKAADQGRAEAQLSLGVMYHNGEGVPKDDVMAVEWVQKAADQGYAEAQFNLGVMYDNGISVPKDVGKAVEWYQKAANQGDVNAQFNLGVMYDKGEGVPKDDVRAVEWWQKAAAQGLADAQYNLSLAFWRGKGVPKDLILAYAWVNLSAASGDQTAIENRRKMEGLLSKNDLAEAQSLSSAWKKGQLLVREGRQGVVGNTPGATKKLGTGTAFVVGKDGHAITNQHVIKGCTELRIEGRDGIAKKVTEDAVNDLALLQIPGEIKATAAIAPDSAKLRQGEDIVVFGFPLNAVLSSGGNLTPGVVSALTGLGNNTNQIQITAPIQPGSSGSPVLNKKGNVVAVVAMKLDDAKMAKATGSIGQNVNFAVSGQTLKTFLDTHKVDYRTSGLVSFDKSTADLADEARKWTMVVECWK